MKKLDFHLYISDDNEKYLCYSHDHMFHLFKLFFESVILLFCISTVWEYTNVCAKQYRYALDIYLIIMLASSYGIIMYCAINVPGHGNNVVDRLNATDEPYLKGEMELVGKLADKDTSNISMLPGDSKDVFINFSDQCIHILNNTYRLNGPKGSKKMQKREYLFKYQ